MWPPIGSLFQVTTWKVGGSGKYAPKFSGAGEEALIWQDSKARIAINTLSGEVEESSGEDMCLVTQRLNLSPGRYGGLLSCPCRTPW